MDQRTYKPVTVDDLATFLRQARDAGLAVTPASDTAGSVKGFGTEVDYQVFEKDGVAHLTLAHHLPFAEDRTWQVIEQHLPSSIGRV